MIGASMRPSGRFPVVNAVTICSVVQLPIPVSLSGVIFLPGNTPRPGISNPTSEPPRYRALSGLPRKNPGVWQSLHPARTTKYLPRSTGDSARARGSRVAVTATTATAVAAIPMHVEVLMTFPPGFAYRQTRARLAVHAAILRRVVDTLKLHWPVRQQERANPGGYPPVGFCFM